MVCQHGGFGFEGFVSQGFKVLGCSGSANALPHVHRPCRRVAEDDEGRAARAAEGFGDQKKDRENSPSGEVGFRATTTVEGCRQSRNLEFAEILVRCALNSKPSALSPIPASALNLKPPCLKSPETEASCGICQFR